MRNIQPSPAANWALRLSHPKWGKADIVCLREYARPPQQLIDFDPSLTKEEREQAHLGESTVSVMLEGERRDVLRDRKNLLRFLRAVMGGDGMVAVDHTAQRFWPREALDDELCHDADLDIESLYTLHAITDDQDEHKVVWLHSHGLSEIGLFDFDVLQPSEDLLGRGRDALRVIAFAILEGNVERNTPRFTLMRPGGDVRFVEVRDFQKRASRAANILRIGADQQHASNRAVLCDPAGGWLSRFFGRITPSHLLSQPAPDDMTVPFSTPASSLMAERALGTYLQLQQLAGEFAEFEFPIIVKLGYRIDSGGPDEREHLWFQVHELGDVRIDATLESTPFSISRMKKNQRAWHLMELLTDWAILTPLGTITPRHTVPARQIRGSRDQFRELLQQARQHSEAG